MASPVDDPGEHDPRDERRADDEQRVGAAAALLLRPRPSCGPHGAGASAAGGWLVGASPFARAIRLGFSFRMKAASCAAPPTFAYVPPRPRPAPRCCSWSAAPSTSRSPASDVTSSCSVAAPRSRAARAGGGAPRSDRRDRGEDPERPVHGSLRSMPGSVAAARPPQTRNRIYLLWNRGGGRSKAERQRLIGSVVTRRRIGTQEDLRRALANAGCLVTQATVSRDIRELRLEKTRTSWAGRATRAEPRVRRPTRESLTAVLEQFGPSAIAADNIVVVELRARLGPGDRAGARPGRPPESVGTLAGDDTCSRRHAERGRRRGARPRARRLDPLGSVRRRAYRRRMARVASAVLAAAVGIALAGCGGGNAGTAISSAVTGTRPAPTRPPPRSRSRPRARPPRRRFPARRSPRPRR